MTDRLAFRNVEAENFLKVLGLVDRTILPRRLFLSNGEAHLVLLAARQRASLEGAPSGSAEAIATAITRLCRAGRPVDYRLEPLSRGPSAPQGFSALEVLNAQAQAGGADERQYRFAQDGWPLSAPAGASFASLNAAARIAGVMSGWQGLHNDQLQPPTLILAVSDTLTQDLSVSVEGNLTFTATPSASLGRLVSRWQHRSAGGVKP